MTVLYIILGAIALFVIFGVVGKKMEQNNSTENNNFQKEKQLKNSKQLPTVDKLVNEVKTIEDLKKLKTVYKRAEKSYGNSQSDNPKIEERYRIYEEAYWKAGDKINFYQFVPDLDLNLSKNKLNNAYKIFSLVDFIKLRNKIGGKDHEWVEISLNDFYVDKNFEKKPIYFDSILNFQSIIKDKSKSYKQRIDELNIFAKNNKPFVDEFFYGYKPNEIGEEWIKEELLKYGIPLIDRLYELGYTLPESFLDLKIDDIKNISGFGPKKIEQLKQAIKKIETMHNK